MENQLQRLATFFNFGTEYPVHPIRLAEAGFIYEGKADEVKCFACDLKHKGWKAGDNPLQLHLSLSPGCQFIKTHPKSKKNNPEKSSARRITPKICQHSSNAELSPHDKFNVGNHGNICIPREHRQPRYYSENASPEPCIHSYNRRTVSAPSSFSDCENVESSSFRCATSVSNHGKSQKRTSSQTTFTRNQGHSQTSGLFSAPLMYPAYVIVSVRQASYINKPRSFTPQKSLFLFIGERDHVRCFFCGVGLKDWEPEDDPWTEHARWSPNCDFVLVVMNISPDTSQCLPCFTYTTI